MGAIGIFILKIDVLVAVVLITDLLAIANKLFLSYIQIYFCFSTYNYKNYIFDYKNLNIEAISIYILAIKFLF